MGEIIKARFTGKDRAEATLTLFDGKSGTVEASKWGSFRGWANRWLTLDGAINWNGTAWERVPEEVG